MLKTIKPGDFAIAALLLLPLMLAWPRLWPPSGEGVAALLSFTGRLTGILGLAAMLVAAMLSVRLPGLDRWLGGLPRIWTVHRLLGFGAFVLILAHVLLLAFAALPVSIDMAVNVLFPPLAHGAVWVGWAALALMVAFLAPTFQFFGPPAYQRWKRLHLLSAPALLLGAGHAIFLTRASLAWWLLTALALAAILWRKGLSPRLGRHEYTVEGVVRLTPDVVEISLAPAGPPIRHGAGQFVYLTPYDPALTAGRGEEHPYTISSAPDEPLLRIGIKALGDASHAIQAITPGSTADVEGPYGRFFERQTPARKQLWLGGGIGITPFVSGARELASKPEGGTHVFLLYLANRRARAYYLDELEEIGRNHDALTVAAHYFSEYGPIDAAFLKAHCPDFVGREIYICGPPGMNRHLLQLLARAGVPKPQIHTEAFDFL